MPITNVGILPGGAIGNELVAVTRRAFIPRLVVQLYKSTPMLSLLLRHAQRAKGGASQITVPVQGGQFVNFSWSDYSGAFPQPAVQTAAQNAEFNLKLGVVPIPFLGMESIIQSTEAVIPLLKARMADAKTVALQGISTALYTNNSAVAGQTQVDGLPQAYDDGTNVGTYGGINRTTNTFWKSTLKTGAGGILSRSAMIPFLVQLTALAGGESPDFVVMSPSDWSKLMTDFISGEQYNTTPRSRYGADDIVNSGYRGLMLGDTPIFMDPFLAKGTAFLFNSRYLALYMSEDAPFAFSGFYSSIPNLQIANVGVVIVVFNVVCTKPISGMQIQGITGGSF
jgi:hypothetical protein